MNHNHALRAFHQRAWAIEINAHQAIRELLQARANGEGPTPDELDAWEASSPYGAANNTQTPAGQAIAIIPLHGVMLQRASGMQKLSGATDTREFAATLTAAANDPSVAEIILDVDSPGGEATSVDPAVQAMQYATTKKPVTAVTQGMMASAAYWVSSQATKIVASPGALVGSISVIWTHEDWSARNAQEGVQVTHLTTGAKKALGNMDQPLSDAARAEMMRIATDYHQAFVNAVAAGRGRSADQVQADWADGRIELGPTALKLGMIDQIGTLQETIDQALQEGSSAGARAEGKTMTPKVLAALGLPEDATEEQALEAIDGLTISASTAAEAEAEADQARAALEADAAAQRRAQLADNALAAAELPPVSVDSDQRFHDALVHAAQAADSDDGASTVITSMIEDRQAVLSAARTDNHPDLPDGGEDARNNDAKSAVAQLRARHGLPN